MRKERSTSTYYSVLMKTERLQVLIETAQRERLEQTATSRGTSVATLVREAIDLVFPVHAEFRAQAAQDILAAEPMDVPEVDDLVAELNEIRGRRQ